MVTKEDLAIAEKNLLDPLWRINNLYYIVDKNGSKKLFTLNWAQQELYENIWYNNLVLKARQLGVSTFCCILFLDRCLFNSNTLAGILSYTQEDAKVMFKKIKFAYDSLPEELRAERIATVDSAMELTFNNGSCIRVGTSMRGSTLKYLHISEFGKICATDPAKEREIITGSLNTLAPGKSYCFIESTAEGREGAFYEMCKKAQDMQAEGKPLTNMDYRFHFFPWHQCTDYVLKEPVLITEEKVNYFRMLEDKGITLSQQQKSWYVKKEETQFDAMKREFPTLPEEAFETAITGAYYAKQLSLARSDYRICRLYHDESRPTHTAWDLGYGDSTSIWIFQLEGKEIHLLEYIEGSNEALTYYLKILKDKNYLWGYHFAPHDALHHEFGSGLTRSEIARKNGFNFTVVQNDCVDEGIDAVRYMFPRFWFDETKCSRGVVALDNYRRQWNARQGCWGSKPQHDDHSHGADAIRMLACGLPKVTDHSGPSDAEVQRMYEKHNPRFS